MVVSPAALIGPRSCEYKSLVLIIINVMRKIVLNEHQRQWTDAWNKQPKLSLHTPPRRYGKTWALAHFVAHLPQDVQVVVACATNKSNGYFRGLVDACTTKSPDLVDFNNLMDFDSYPQIDWSKPTLVVIDEGTCMDSDVYEKLFKPAMSNKCARIIGLATPCSINPGWFELYSKDDKVTDDAVKEAMKLYEAETRKDRISKLNKLVVEGQDAQDKLLAMCAEEV